MDKEIITVTSPLLPSLEDFFPYLEDIWKRKWLTNNGYYHQQLEKALCEYLKVSHISLFTNGTLPLIVGLQALQLTGEIITTPFSFVATTHAIHWNNLKPVFVDIDPSTCNIDINKIEAAITSRTTAIMPVHVYGTPCDTDNIQKIADKYGLKVIYDAAHAFGVEINGNSILNNGDLSALSFHATKVYNTIEGGALICRDQEMKQKIDSLKNFGYTDEINVSYHGLNGKLDEIRAAYGILNLKQVDKAIEKRHKIAKLYRTLLSDISGIRYLEDLFQVRHNYSYFPIFIDCKLYGKTRDELYMCLKKNKIFGRRYFYPLISKFDMYRNIFQAIPNSLPVAKKIADEVICLPIYPDLGDEVIEYIVDIIKNY